MFARGWAGTAPRALAYAGTIRPPKGKDTRARPGAVQGGLEQGIHCSAPEGSHMESLVGSLAKSASVFGDGLSARRYASGSESRMRLANSNPIGVAIFIPPCRSATVMMARRLTADGFPSQDVRQQQAEDDDSREQHLQAGIQQQLEDHEDRHKNEGCDSGRQGA